MYSQQLESRIILHKNFRKPNSAVSRKALYKNREYVQWMHICLTVMFHEVIIELYKEIIISKYSKSELSNKKLPI